MMRFSQKISTCWSRSNDLWVMSPTRFLCAKVLRQNDASRRHTQMRMTTQHTPPNDSNNEHPHTTPALTKRTADLQYYYHTRIRPSCTTPPPRIASRSTDDGCATPQTSPRSDSSDSRVGSCVCLFADHCILQTPNWRDLRQVFL